jgi:ATP-dependent Clp protease ATP-binding subunit ClpC
MLKPALGRSEMRVIGATTTVEYDRWVGRDEAMARRFERLEVPEPDEAQTRAILTGVRERMARHYGLSIEDDALAAAVELTSRHLPARRQPDKSIDVLDEACARAVVRGATGALGRDEIAHVIALRAGVALESLTKDDRATLGTLEERVGARVIGQPEAVATVCRFVVRGRLGLKPPDRPEGAVLLIGPSGVGKSWLANVIAEEAYGGGALLRVDLAEYGESHQVSRLIGSPPGYVGYNEEGLLTGWLRRRPHSVVLLDEVDKAHAKIRELLLGILDAGRLADGRGVQVSCAHALFLLTSAGAATDVRKSLGNELTGRLDAVVAMVRLGTMELRRIAELQVAEAKARLGKNRVTLEVDDAVIRRLAAEADGELGARPIKAAVERALVDPIAKLLLERSGPLEVRARVVDDRIVVA